MRVDNIPTIAEDPMGTFAPGKLVGWSYALPQWIQIMNTVVGKRRVPGRLVHCKLPRFNTDR